MTTVSYVRVSPCEQALVRSAAILLALLPLCMLALRADQAFGQTAFCGTVPNGIYASGFNCAPVTGVPATIATLPGDSISTTAGVALRAAAQNADAKITVDGTSITSNVAALANGVQAQVTNGVGNASIVFSGAASSVTIGPGGDNGVFEQNNTSGSSTVFVGSGVHLSISNNNATGSERDAFEINSTGSGSASVDDEGAGAISTANGNGFWIKAANGGSAFAEAGSDVSFVINKPAVGGNYAAIHTRVVGNGATTIINSAPIAVSGDNAFGIYSQADSGATSVTNHGDIKTSGLNGFGIRVPAGGAGDILVDNTGAITTTGTAAHGIYLNSQGGAISVANDGAITVGSAAATDGSRGIYINAFVGGDIDVTGKGDITVLGNAGTTRGHAIILNAASGNINVEYSGSLTSQGNGSGGIRADATMGNVHVNYDGEKIETFNQDGTGIYASSRSPTGLVDVRSSGTIITHADAGSGDGSGSGAFGLEGISYGGDVSVAFTGSRIDVNGSGAAILAANAYFTGTGLGAVSVDNSGDVIARGDREQGIRTFSTLGVQTISNTGAIQTLGATDSQGILAITNGAAPIVITNGGAITTIGNNSSGIDAVSHGGTLTVSNLGAITAGWGTSAGISVGGSAQTLDNNGAIQALSDVAVRGDAEGFGGSFHITNTGTITGAVDASTSVTDFQNNGTWWLRNFSDSDGDSVRDRLAVAVSDLGQSGANIINNLGTIALIGQGAGAARAVDTGGQYLPLGLTFNAMAAGGPVQGQILGATTFSNSGVIDLQANPAPGDVLLISGGHTPGASGGGGYVSNGGRLLLDTVLNEGGPNSRSDVLVLDGASVGAGGATQTFIHNVGGTGALTVGDGILVVQVLDPARSAPGAFALAGEVREGAFDYDLFHGGVGGSNSADWFLRNDFVVPPPGPPTPSAPPSPLPPAPPPNPLTPGVSFPIIGPELATYGVVQPLARQLGLAILGTLDDRVGDTYDPDGCGVAVAPEISSVDLPTRKSALPTRKAGLAPCPLFSPSVWGRFFGQTVNNHYQAFADPRADGNLGGFQGGIDLLRGPVIPGGYDRMGLYGGYGNVNTDVTGLVTNPAATAYVLNHTGSMNLNAWSGGAYWTHVGPSGWYLDGVVQGTGYGGSASTANAHLSTDGWGFLASLEGGYPFLLPQFGPGFVIEPQGQVLWQKVSFRHDYDGLGDVALGDTTGPSGRIGLRTKWTIVTVGGQVWQPYVQANLWRDWSAEATTTFSGVDQVPLLTQATRLELGGGLTAKINANVSLHASADYEFAIGNTQNNWRSGVQGVIGARYTW